MPTYAEVYAEAQRDPTAFWGRAAQGIDWFVPPEQVLTRLDDNHYQWFRGGVTNACYNALDRHVLAGRGAKTAIIYDSPLTSTKTRITYSELLRRVSAFASVLHKEGVRKGDTVLIYMPMIPDTLVAMYACARLGAVHSVVFGGFAPQELAKRVDDARPALVLAASCGIEPKGALPYVPLVERALALSAHRARRVIVKQRAQCPAQLPPGGVYVDWDEAVAASGGAAEGAPLFPCAAVAATDPLYILYTSGTTGVPKGVVRDTGGYLVALQWSMRNIYDVTPEDVYWSASDVGWVVGHSYIVYGPLVYGATTVLYEGKPVGTPDAGAFWRVIAEYGVRAMFTAPTALRAIRKEDPDATLMRKYDLSRFDALYLAGERADPATVRWAQACLRKPVVDHWWQTETGWAIGANLMGVERLPVKPGSCTKAVPGYDVRVLDTETHAAIPPGEMGDIVIKLPLPPGCFPTLWKQDDRFVESYLSHHPGFYNTGDAGVIDEDGYISIMSRTDDIINTAGHRLSTGGIEEVLGKHGDVAECAVVGAKDEMKGEVAMGLVVVKAGAGAQDESPLKASLVDKVRGDIGPVAAFKRVVIVKRLPKTRSGKILRGTIKKIVDGVPYSFPATIEDPAVLDEIHTAVGMPKSLVPPAKL